MAEVKPVPGWALRALRATNRGWYSDEDAATALMKETPFQEVKALAEMVVGEFTTVSGMVCHVSGSCSGYTSGHSCDCGREDLVNKARALLQKLEDIPPGSPDRDLEE